MTDENQPDPSTMVQKWVKSAPSKSHINLPKRHARLTKSTLPFCKADMTNKTPCRVQEKPLPYCSGKNTSNRPCRHIERLAIYRKKDIHDIIPPQYRLNPPTVKTDTFFQ